MTNCFTDNIIQIHEISNLYSTLSERMGVGRREEDRVGAGGRMAALCL